MQELSKNVFKKKKNVCVLYAIYQQVLFFGLYL